MLFHLKLKVLMVLAILSIAAPAFSADDEYYTIDEESIEMSMRAKPQHIQVQALLSLAPQQLYKTLKSALVNLLRWNHHAEIRPQPEENYIRKLHFGRWINDPSDNTCMNTRARVLVRDSEEEVSYRGTRECVVDTGKWTDPYSGNEYTVAREVQIDHMVPLKHAYLAGAWQWDYKTRCLYSNYMGFKNHLVPASIRENTSKGDRGPEKYLPSNEAYRCQYVRDWLIVKLIWQLSMTSEEVAAIDAVVQNYSCDIRSFKVTASELAEQREYIQSNIEFCMQRNR